MSNLISAADKRKQLEELKKEKEKWNSLSAIEQYKLKELSKKEEFNKKAKVILIEEIKKATSFPYTITHGPLLDWDIVDLIPWLNEFGYNLTYNWYDSGNGEFITSITIDFK